MSFTNCDGIYRFSYAEDHLDCCNKKCALCDDCGNNGCENNPKNKKTAEAAK